jgi:hypothetical protein
MEQGPAREAAPSSQQVSSGTAEARTKRTSDPAKAEPKVEIAIPKDDADARVPWPYKAEDNPLQLPVRRNVAATSAQRSAAVSEGRCLVAAYDPKTIKTSLMMPITVGTKTGVMIFDGKRGELVNDQIYFVEFRPDARTWVDVAGFKGVYLDP